MLAARIHEYGGVPVVEDVPEPTGGEAVVDVLAAGLNPIDLRLASGTLMRKPPLPSVVGSEGVGSLDGRRVYVDSGGAFAERAAVDPASVVEIPDGVDERLAVCFGIAGIAAYLSLVKGRPEGARVLVLGATGIVGLLAVQIAKLMGAERVVAAGRSPEGLERATSLGADAVVRLADEPSFDEEFDVVIDPLWGKPAEAALASLGFRGRLVQLGQSAGATASFSSVDIRFKELQILGHTNFASSFEARRDAFVQMCEWAAAGKLDADYEAVPLERVAEAWERQASSPNVKLVVVP